MSVLSPEEFWEFFEAKGRFPDGSYIAARGYRSEAQKDLKYRQYLRSQGNKAQAQQRAVVRQRQTPVTPTPPRLDAQWELVREAVLRRDRYQCRLLAILPPAEAAQLCANSGGHHKLVDCAHIKARSTHPQLKYEISNIVALNRYSHSCLDTGRCPVSGRRLTPEEVEQWWQKILKS